MRRFAAVILSLLLLPLYGCGQKSPPEPVSPLAGRAAAGYETTANITYKELRATAAISQTSPESCTVTFTSPDTVKDLSFVFTRDEVDVRYKGLSVQFDPGAVPGSAPAGIVVSAINMAMKDNGLNLSLTDSGMELSGMLESGEFFLRLDGQEGNLLKLLVPSQELEIEFVNFRFLE